ncbi:THAP domain-containing protein 8 [Etheostoma spectabile]|uniref:THAP domain-containing protein 8 n=1 Tax=Etheostoma spectabile TaxID=54343 RepID=UPI0013AEC18B|nr:THAP domain-containing protein 8-like [Etheostoma spectabile]
MVQSCCAPGCQSYRGKDNENKSYYRIPKDPERGSQWIAAIGRARSGHDVTEPWRPGTTLVHVCSDHFISGRKSNRPGSPDYVPSVFADAPPTEKTRSRLRLDVFNRLQETNVPRIETAAKPSADGPPADQGRESNLHQGLSVPRENPATPPCDREHGAERRRSDPGENLDLCCSRLCNVNPTSARRRRTSASESFSEALWKLLWRPTAGPGLGQPPRRPAGPGSTTWT